MVSWLHCSCAYREPEHKGRRAWGELLIRKSSRDQKEARVPLDSQRHTPSGQFFHCLINAVKLGIHHRVNPLIGPAFTVQSRSKPHPRTLLHGEPRLQHTSPQGAILCPNHNTLNYTR